MKKFLSLLLSLIILLSLFSISFTVSAEEKALILPESTSLFIKISLENGEITLSDTDLFKLNVAEEIYQGLKGFETEVDISHLEPQKYINLEYIISSCVQYVITECPDIFWLQSVSFYYDIENRKISFCYEENLKETVTPLIDEYNFLLNQIVEKVPRDITDLQKALFVYNYLSLNFEYDNTLEIHDVYNFLKQKTGVCDSYSKTFKAVMEKLGVPVTRALNTAANHAWNIIKINGINYHIDATHADPVPDSYGYVSYEYFMRSTAALQTIDTEGKRNLYQAAENYYFGFSNFKCDDTSYNSDYLWSEADTAFAFYDGYFYFIKDESYYEYWTYEDGSYITDENGVPYIKDFVPLAAIYKTKDFKTKTLILKHISKKWTVSGNSFYPNYFAGLSVINSQLYFNTADTIVYHDLLTAQTQTVCTIPSDYVYSFYYSGDSTFSYMSLNTQGYISKANLTLSDKGQLGKNPATFADDIVVLRKYLLSGDSSNICLAKADVSGNDQEINVIDLIHLKKMAAGIV